MSLHHPTDLPEPLLLIYTMLVDEDLKLLIDWILYVQVNNLSDMSRRVFLGRTSTKQGQMFLSQGHSTVTPVLSKHSTTEPLGSCEDLNQNLEL